MTAKSLALALTVLLAATSAHAEIVATARFEHGTVQLSDNYCPGTVSHYTSREKIAVYSPARGAPSHGCYERIAGTVYVRWVDVGGAPDDLQPRYEERAFTTNQKWRP